jgi:hypothetical protein
MVKLPEYQSNHPLTRDPQSSVSPADIANPFEQIARGLSGVGEMLQKRDVYEAANDGRNNGVWRDTNGQLHVDQRSNLSEVGRTYNDAANQRFGVEAQNEIRTRLQQLAIDAKGNPDNFRASYDSFKNEFLGSTPAHLRGAVTTMFDTEGPRVALGVSEEKRKRDLTLTEQSTKDHIQMLMDDAGTLARAGGVNTPAYKQSVAQIRSLYEGLVKNPDFAVSQESVDISLKRMEGQNMSEAMLGQVDKALQAGGITEARKLANSVLTDTSIALDPKERRAYSSLMNSQIDGFIADRKADLKPFQDKAKEIQKRLKQGIDLDNTDVDSTAQALARSGDVGGALELFHARAAAKLTSTFKISDNARQATLAEDAIGTAQGGDTLLAAIKSVESTNDPTQVSPKGAAGIMQVLPSTARDIARELGDKNFPANASDQQIRDYLKKPAIGEAYGTHYLNKMLVKYGGDKEAALIAYNGGPDRADKWLSSGRDDSVLPAETRDYYHKVLDQTKASADFSPEDVSTAKSFLQTRTDKGPEAITGLDDRFAVKVSRLLQAAPPGISEKLGVFSGRRTYARQAELWSEALVKYGSPEEARRHVAPPGHSNHESGFAADLSYNGKSLEHAPPEVVSWLHDNAGKFGLKFPLGNENWHVEDDSTRGGKAVIANQPPPVDADTVKDFRDEIKTDLNDSFPDIQKMFQSGMPMEPGSINLLSRQLAIVDDQDIRQKYADMFAKADAAGQLDGVAPAEREALLSSMKADAQTGATVAQSQMMQWLQDSSKAKDEAIKSDPIGYAIGRKYVERMPPLNIDDPSSWAGTLQQQQRAVNVMQARGEVGAVSALRPEQQQQIASLWQQGDPNKLAGLTNSLASSLNPETLRATLSSGPVKEALKGAVLSTDPVKYTEAMRQLDLLANNGKTSLFDLQTDFGEEAVNRLQDWQGMVRYYTADEMQKWLQQRNDPAWQQRTRPLVSKGEEEARKIDTASIVDKLDTNHILDTVGPIDEQTQRMMQNDFVMLSGMRNASLSDPAKAQEQAIERMHKVWGVTSVYGNTRGRLMPYPPEAFYPEVASSHDWIGTELAGIAAAHNTTVDNISLIADGKTKALIDSKQPPGYLISIVNRDTGMEEMLTNDKGQVIRHFFDPAAAQQGAMNRAVQDRNSPIRQRRQQLLDNKKKLDELGVPGDPFGAQ